MPSRLGVLLALASSMSCGVDALVAGIANDPKGSLPLHTLNVKVPEDLGQFREQFMDLLRQDSIDGEGQSFHRSEKRNMAKISIAVFTTLTGRSRHIRQILRDTWMRHPDVCTMDNVTEDCVFRVCFVAGRYGQDWVKDYSTRLPDGHWVGPERDVLLMDIHENMNEGKTFHWLRYASRTHTWADYIAKIDDDAFLHVTNALDTLPIKPDVNLYEGVIIPNIACEAFLGKPWTCSSHDDACPPKKCPPPYDRMLGEYDHNMTGRLGVPYQNCWAYMQGGFYALSRNLAKDITEPGSWLEEHKNGPEDRQTGHAVAEWMKKTHRCVQMWNKEDVADERIFYHARAGHEHPGGMGKDWDEYYNVRPGWGLPRKSSEPHDSIEPTDAIGPSDGIEPSDGTEPRDGIDKP